MIEYEKNQNDLIIFGISYKQTSGNPEYAEFWNEVLRYKKIIVSEDDSDFARKFLILAKNNGVVLNFLKSKGIQIYNAQK